MKNFSSRFAIFGLSTILLSTVSISPAYAGLENLKFKSGVKTEALFENNNDLDTSNTGSVDSEFVEGKFGVFGDITDQFAVNLDARGVKNYGAGGSIDLETGEAQGQEDFLELRQYWVQYKNFTNQLPLSVKLGRQRIKEDRSLWWNKDLDALSVTYDATLMKGFLAVGQDLREYRTTGDTYNEDDQDVMRLLGETSWQWKQGHFFETRFTYQNDHSGLRDAGYRMEAGDRDSSDSDLLWAGIRAAGELGCFICKDAKHLGYRADLIYLTGSQDNELSTAGADGYHTVTGSSDEDVRAWAMDLGVDVPVVMGGISPVFTFGYAFGSGDDNASDDTDHAFRQTGLDSNSSRLNGASSSLHNYGSVLRPDLSNIHILTAGVAVPLTQTVDLSTVYHYYHLSEEATSLATSGVSASLNGTDKGIGHGLDVMVNVDVSEQFAIKRRFLDNIDFKTTLGAFKAGDAYGSADDETAFRGQFDLSFKF